MYWLSLYCHLQMANLRSRAVYAVNFAIGVTGIAISGFTSLLLLWVVMQRTSSVEGWSFYELVFMASLWRVCHGLFIILFQQVWDIDAMIRRGLFDRQLVRPAGLLFQLFTAKFQIAGLGELIAGAGGLIWAASHATSWTILQVLWLLCVIAAGAAIEWSLFLAVAATAFWTQKSEALRDVVVTSLFQFTNYPLTAYGPVLHFILTFVLPIGFMHFYPAQAFLAAKSDARTLSMYLSPAVAGITVLAACTLWRRAIRSYQGAGS